MRRDFKRDPVKAAALKEHVKAAFSSVPYPGDENLIRGSSVEAQEIQEFFRGKRWEEITLEKLRGHPTMVSSDGPAFMTVEAFHYYLPAYLMIIIDKKPEADVIPEFIINTLSVTDAPEQRRKWYEARVARFTKAQRRAIKSVLEYVREMYEGLPHADLYAPSLSTIRYWSENS